ncbi:hypothetical protein Fot_35202 [Forsythia ovata]|uniref:Maturase K n=1 Tax=Forsythia ovata TaxID=205694 RepID=A0ABD1SNM6_9LAMI
MLPIARFPFCISIIVSSYQIHFYAGEVPSFFLTEKDIAMISRLYSFKENFYGVIGSDHLFVKHNLMKKQAGNIYTKIVLIMSKEEKKIMTLLPIPPTPGKLFWSPLLRPMACSLWCRNKR